jgi:hypothetical protein
MQDQRNGQPHGLPDPDSLEYRAQKVVLLELVVTPPPGGDRIDDLIDRLAVAATPSSRRSRRFRQLGSRSATASWHERARRRCTSSISGRCDALKSRAPSSRLFGVDRPGLRVVVQA